MALCIDHPQARRRFTEVADHAETGADGRLEIGTAPSVTDRGCIAANSGPFLVEEQSEVAAPRQKMLQVEPVQSAPIPIGNERTQPLGQALESAAECLANGISTIVAAKPAIGVATWRIVLQQLGRQALDPAGQQGNRLFGKSLGSDTVAPIDEEHVKDRRSRQLGKTVAVPIAQQGDSLPDVFSIVIRQQRA